MTRMPNRLTPNERATSAFDALRSRPRHKLELAGRRLTRKWHARDDNDDNDALTLLSHQIASNHRRRKTETWFASWRRKAIPPVGWLCSRFDSSDHRRLATRHSSVLGARVLRVPKRMSSARSCHASGPPASQHFSEGKGLSCKRRLRG